MKKVVQYPMLQLMEDGKWVGKMLATQIARKAREKRERMEQAAEKAIRQSLV